MEEKGQTKIKGHKMKTMGIVLLLATIGCGLWARYISTSGLIVREYAIKNNKISSKLNGLKIIHFSDLHYGSTTDQEDLKELVKIINSYHPDIVAFTGDLIEEDVKLSDQEVTAVTEILEQIDCSFKFAVSGNHDKKGTPYKEILKNSNFKLLNNEKEMIYYLSNEPVEISGFPSSFEYKQNYKVLKEKNSFYKIVLIHEPDLIDKLSPYRVNLVLAGHSHNGQIRVPFIGAIYTPPKAQKYYEAYYKVNGTDLYVSSGVGTSKLKMRFFNKPSINLYRLYAE